MTPAKLDKLRRIDAHLANLLATAEKRTPGEWYSHPETLDNGRLFNTINAEESFVANVCSTAFVHEDAAFIAACAGNAEAGWRATRSLINYLLMLHKHGDGYRYVGLTEDLLAAFPNV